MALMVGIWGILEGRTIKAVILLLEASQQAGSWESPSELAASSAPKDTRGRKTSQENPTPLQMIVP